MPEKLHKEKPKKTSVECQEVSKATDDTVLDPLFVSVYNYPSKSAAKDTPPLSARTRKGAKKAAKKNAVINSNKHWGFSDSGSQSVESIIMKDKCESCSRKKSKTVVFSSQAKSRGESQESQHSDCKHVSKKGVFDVAQPVRKTGASKCKKKTKIKVTGIENLESAKRVEDEASVDGSPEKSLKMDEVVKRETRSSKKENLKKDSAELHTEIRDIAEESVTVTPDVLGIKGKAVEKKSTNKKCKIVLENSTKGMKEIESDFLDNIEKPSDTENKLLDENVASHLRRSAGKRTRIQKQGPSDTDTSAGEDAMMLIQQKKIRSSTKVGKKSKVEALTTPVRKKCVSRIGDRGSPLSTSVSGGSPGSAIKKKNKKGETPLHVACIKVVITFKFIKL